MENWIENTTVTEIQKLFHDSYQINEAIGIHFEAATISREHLEEYLLTTALWVTRKHKELVSTVAVRFPWSKNPSPFSLPHLGWIATAKNFQGQGSAKSLITSVINLLQDQYRVPAVTLGTAKEHPWLISAYEKLGFVYLSETQKFADHKTVYLIKVLDQEGLLQVKDKSLQRLLKERDLV